MRRVLFGVYFLLLGLALSAACAGEGTTRTPLPLSKDGKPVDVYGQAYASGLDILDLAARRLVGPNHVWPRSDWLNAEKAAFSALLATGRFDVLVVPAQVRGYALDRIGRSLITAILAERIEAMTSARVPNSWLAARALGEGMRSLDDKEVYRLAETLQVKTIVWTHVGHIRDGKFHVTIRSQTRTGNTPLGSYTASNTQTLSDLPLSDERPPHAVFAEHVENIINGLKLTGSRRPLALGRGRVRDEGLPASPLDGIESLAENPLRAASRLQLLGVLFPSNVERARERIFERSLIALQRVAPDSPDYALLTARALFYLNMRPAALAAIGKNNAPEERALAALLNGNRPAHAKAIAEIEHPAQRTIARIEHARLRQSYGEAASDTLDPQLVEWAKRSPEWGLPLAQALLEADGWDNRSNLDLKLVQDKVFPLSGFNLETLILGVQARVAGEGARIELELSPFNHQRKLLAEMPKRWCCSSTAAQPTAWDYLDLIEAYAENNLFKQVNFLLQLQGTPAPAAELLDGLDVVFRGHPRFEVLRAQTLQALAMQRQGIERTALMRRSADAAIHALYWGQGQSHVTAAAWHESLRAAAHPAETTVLTEAYVGDHPFRPYWSGWEQGGNVLPQIANAQRVLLYATDDFGSIARVFPQLSMNNPGLRPDPDAVLREIAGRFVGDPARSSFLAKFYTGRGDHDTVKAVHTEAITLNPHVWEPYASLGLLMIQRDADYAGAARLFEKYPFNEKQASGNLVRLSNNYAQAGDLFFWLGIIPEARKFLERSANLRTGSDASLRSAARVNLIDGKLAEAAEISLQRAQRYRSVYAYRDYLGLLHTMGRSAEAWPIFNALAPQFENPQMWASAMVGQRLERRSLAEIKQWLMQPQLRNVAAGAYRHASAHFILSALVDRAPVEGLAKIIEEIEGDSRSVVTQDGWVVGRMFGPGARPAHLGPSRFKGVLDTSVYRPGTEVRSALSYFAQAYTLLAKRDYSAAFGLFDELARFYDITSDELSFVLPYYALAAGKAGKSETLEPHLKSMFAPDRAFDIHLATAFFAAARGDHADAVQLLGRALRTKAFTEKRPILIEYQYAQACEWLYEDTKQTQYRELALDWAKKHQVIQPIFAWAYGMEAKLTNSEADRQRALAIAQYLDGESAAISGFSKAQRDAAAAWLKSNNPFLRGKGARAT